MKTWYGRFREDVPQADGQIVRRSRNVRLGTLTELPTKAAARNKLADQLRNSEPSVEMNFCELSERWQTVAMPTLKLTTGAHYRNALRAYVIPAFGKRKISTIGRFDVETFLSQHSKKYSRSTLRSMRVSLSLVMSWAVACRWIAKNPCAGVKLPRDSNCAGRRVVRTVLKLAQVTAIAEKLEEPYSTLVFFLAVTGLRIGEAIAVTWSDFDGDVLSITRRICDGNLDTVKSESSCRKLPIPSELISRMRQLGEGEWIFRSREGTPVNPGNALKRYVRPVAKDWHLNRGVARLSAYAYNEHAPWWGASESDLGNSWAQWSNTGHEHLRSSGSGRFPVAAAARVRRVVTKCYEIGRSSLKSLRQLIKN